MEPAAPEDDTCQFCRGAGFVTYRDGIPYETHDVEKEEHLIEDCPECKGSGLVLPGESYGAQCSSYPNCNGGCGLGCTHEIEGCRSSAND